MIELMIVVAIIGILVAVAIPGYQSYSKRARVSELLLAGSTCRTAISHVYQSGSPGAPPGANAFGCETTAPSVSKYVATVSTDANGAVTITAQNFGDATIDGRKVTMVPMATATAAATWAGAAGTTLYGWRCGSPADGTTLPQQYLPGSCRG